jgi:hypothetical protein
MIRRIAHGSLVAFLSFVLSGCAVTHCGMSVKDEGELEVKVEKQVDRWVAIGKNLAVTALAGGNPLITAAASVAQNVVIDPILVAGVEAEALSLAKDYVAQNSGQFCNQCDTGQCQATLEAHPLTLKKTTKRPGTMGQYSVIFRFAYSGHISCGVCPGCIPSPVAGGGPSSCLNATEYEIPVLAPTWVETHEAVADSEFR